MSDVSLTCSVVVPVRDDAAQLRGLLVALARQSEPPLEVIVVDNGSSDDSAAIAHRAGCTVVREPRPGIAAAAATGYDASRGDLIVRCDADSRPPRGWLAAHRRAHERARPRTVAVTGPAYFTLPCALRPIGPVLSGAYLGAYVLASGAALGHVPLFGTTMSLRRSWWEQVGESASRDDAVHDDMDLSFRVRPGERVGLSPRVRVGMSVRALRPGVLARRRWYRAIATLRRNWGEQRPWERWRSRCAVATAIGWRAEARTVAPRVGGSATGDGREPTGDGR